eukprot:scaffold444_cov42-Cyclotella_meneghiniana.AAC.2
MDVQIVQFRRIRSKFQQHQLAACTPTMYTNPIDNKDIAIAAAGRWSMVDGYGQYLRRSKRET